MTIDLPRRLTHYAAGGGCACKVPPGELERVLGGLTGGRAADDLLVGVEDGDEPLEVADTLHGHQRAFDASGLRIQFGCKPLCEPRGPVRIMGGLRPLGRLGKRGQR